MGEQVPGQRDRRIAEDVQYRPHRQDRGDADEAQQRPGAAAPTLGDRKADQHREPRDPDVAAVLLGRGGEALRDR